MTDFIHWLDHQLFFLQVKTSVTTIVETKVSNNPGCIRKSNSNILVLQFQSSLTFGLRQLTLLTSTKKCDFKSSQDKYFYTKKKLSFYRTNTQHD